MKLETVVIYVVKTKTYTRYRNLKKSHGLSANAHLVKIGIKLTVTYLTYINKTISGVRNLSFLHSSNISQAITSQAQICGWKYMAKSIGKILFHGDLRWRELREAIGY